MPPLTIYTGSSDAPNKCQVILSTDTFPVLCRSEKTRKLRELHEELTTLDTDIQQVAAQAGAPALLEGPPAAPERPSEAELLRRRIAETDEHPAAAARGHAVPGFPGPSNVTSLTLPSSHLCRACRFECKCSAQRQVKRAAISVQKNTLFNIRHSPPDRPGMTRSG